MERTLIDTVWGLLPHIARLEFQASPGAASVTQWQGRGEADVRVERTADAIRFIESGQFRPRASSAPVSVRNVYLWQRDGPALLLSHERLGRDSGVFLLRFAPPGPEHAAPEHPDSPHADLATGPDDTSPTATIPGTLEAGAPHQCGQDQYRATLRLTADGVSLDWVVTGPRKDERLVQRYKVAGARPSPP